MIVNYKLKGISTKKDEILGEFSKGGFSSNINYITHLKDLNRIRIDNKTIKNFCLFIIFNKNYKSQLSFLKLIKTSLF